MGFFIYGDVSSPGLIAAGGVYPANSRSSAKFQRGLRARLLALVIVQVVLIVGCSSDDDVSVSKLEQPSQEHGQLQEARNPDKAVSAKADLLAELVELERQLGRIDRTFLTTEPGSELERQSLQTIIGNVRSRTEDLYEQIRVLNGTASDAAEIGVEDQLVSLGDQKREIEQDVAILDHLMQVRSRYLQQRKLSEISPDEPLFQPIGIPLPWASLGLEISLQKWIEDTISQGESEKAVRLYDVGLDLLEKAVHLQRTRQERESQQIAALVLRAESALGDDRLTTPEDDNAALWLTQAQLIQSEHPDVERLWTQLIDRYRVLTESALANGNYRSASAYVGRVESLPVSDEQLHAFSNLREQVAQQVRRGSIAGSMQAAVEAGRRGEIEEVERQIEELRSRAPNDPRLEQIETRYRIMLHQPGRLFLDELDSAQGIEGPTMIVGPRGDFAVGAEKGRFAFFRRSLKVEEPRHQVRVDYPYAVARTETTVGQFRQFVDSTGYVTDAENDGYSEVWTAVGSARVVDRNWRHDWLGREANDDDPVLHVSWRDASRYADWLSEQTGNDYRLLSEAEFEILARSSRTGEFLWNEDDGPGSRSGNFLGGGDMPPREWGSAEGSNIVSELADYQDGYFGPAPVGSYSANEFGIQDLLGNVSEWTQDCRFEDHSESPGDGRPREAGGRCDQRVVRGGSWISGYDSLRLSYRTFRELNYHDSATGFRVAMDL